MSMQISFNVLLGVFDEMESRFGQVDVVVNNAGVARPPELCIDLNLVIFIQICIADLCHCEFPHASVIFKVPLSFP